MEVRIPLEELRSSLISLDEVLEREGLKLNKSKLAKLIAEEKGYNENAVKSIIFQNIKLRTSPKSYIASIDNIIKSRSISKVADPKKVSRGELLDSFARYEGWLREFGIGLDKTRICREFAKKESYNVETVRTFLRSTSAPLKFKLFVDSLLGNKKFLYGMNLDGRVYCALVKPMLEYLGSCGVSVRMLLGQSESYYNKSDTLTISSKVYKRVLHLTCEYLKKDIEDGKLPFKPDQAKYEDFNHLVTVVKLEYEYSKQVSLNTTVAEFKRLAEAMRNGHNDEELTKRFSELGNGRPKNWSELYLSSMPVPDSLRTTVTFEVLDKLNKSELESAKKRLEYQPRFSHRAGELTYVPGFDSFGLIDHICITNNGDYRVQVKLYPSKKEVQLFAGER